MTLAPLTFAQDVLRALTDARLSLDARSWPSIPGGFVICHGQTVRPDPRPGVLIVTGIPLYSAAWL